MDLNKLEETLEDCVYKLSRQKVWNGTDYTYYPLPPAQYFPVIIKLETLLHELATGN